jgi:Short C-terminal domain
MGLMMRRRRPLMRVAAGAAVAGTAYHMGKKGEQQAQVNEQAQDAYAATQQAPPPPPAYAPPTPPAPSGATADLDQLVQFHNSGVLTDEEFTAAKAKLLGI